MDNKQKVYDWIDSHQEDIVKLLQELIQAPSVNAYFDEDEEFKNEELAQQVLRGHLDNMGMKTEFQYPDAEELKEYEGKPGYYADHRFEKRPNLVGVLSEKEAESPLCFPAILMWCSEEANGPMIHLAEP